MNRLKSQKLRLLCYLTYFFLTVAFYHDFSFFLLLIELIFTNLLVLLTHQFIFLYFFNEIISCFTYRFNLNSWVMFPSPTYYTWIKFPFILLAFNAIYLFHRHVFRNAYSYRTYFSIILYKNICTLLNHLLAFCKYLSWYFCCLIIF